MRTLKAIGRVLATLIAIVVLLLCAAGIFGSWYANNVATNVTLRVFSVVDTGVAVVQTGVNRVQTLVQDGRSEVQQAEQTITTVGSNLQENSPVLTALNERLETRLAPTVNNIQNALAPVRDGLQNVSTLVSVANSIPFVNERAPRLEELDNTLSQLSQLGADVQQLNGTLRSSVVDQKNQLTEQAVTTLTTLTGRIDTRLGQTQATVENIQSEIVALQTRLDERQARLLLIYDLAAVLATLLLLWLIYSQIVMIRWLWRREPAPVVTSQAPLPPPAPAPAPLKEPEPTAAPLVVEEAQVPAAPVMVSEPTGAVAFDDDQVKETGSGT